MAIQTLVFPIIIYGAENWIIKNVEREKSDAFKLWCRRKLLGVTYLYSDQNTKIIDIIKPKSTPESRIFKSTLSFFGLVVRADVI